MKIVKKYLMLAVVLIFYVSVISILFRQFYLYQKAYDTLSDLIAHPSIETHQTEFIAEESSE